MYTVKPVLSGHSKRRPKIGFQDQFLVNAAQKYFRMIQGEHSAILSNFIKLLLVFKTFFLTIFEWLLKTGFTVCSTVGLIPVLICFSKSVPMTSPSPKCQTCGRNWAKTHRYSNP